jgi:hypothetical protein
MLRSDWRARNTTVTVALGCVFLLVLGGLIWREAVYQTEIRLQGERSTQVHFEYAEEQVQRDCAGLSGSELSECVYDEIAAAQDHARAKQDLEAQQEMARFTRLMGLTAIVGLFIGALSVWFIYDTLRAARDTAHEAKKATLAAVAAADEAREANRIMRSEARPWVSIDQNVLCDFIHEPGSERCDIWLEYTLTNKGKMPAHNISIFWDVYRFDWKYVGAGRQGVADAAQRAKGKPLHEIPVLFPSERTTRTTHGGSYIRGEEEGTIFLCMGIAYSLDPLGSEQAVSAQAFVLENEDGRFGPFAFQLLSIKRNGYTLIE